MQRNQQNISAGGPLVAFLVLLTAIVLREGFTTNVKWYWVLAFTMPMLVSAIITSYRKPS
jgi:hypothetical protein